MIRSVSMIELLVLSPFGEEAVFAGSLLQIGGLCGSEVFHMLGHYCLVVEGSYIHGGSLLSLEDLVDFDLCPCKHAVFTKLFRNAPPEPSFEEAFDHIGVISTTNIGLAWFVFFMGNCRRLKIEIYVYVMGEHTFPQKLGIALDSFLVDVVLLIAGGIFHLGHLLVEIEHISAIGSRSSAAFCKMPLSLFRGGFLFGGIALDDELWLEDNAGERDIGHAATGLLSLFFVSQFFGAAQVPPSLCEITDNPSCLQSSPAHFHNHCLILLVVAHLDDIIHVFQLHPRALGSVQLELVDGRSAYGHAALLLSELELLGGEERADGGVFAGLELVLGDCLQDLVGFYYRFAQSDALDEKGLLLLFVQSHQKYIKQNIGPPS